MIIETFKLYKGTVDTSSLANEIFSMKKLDVYFFNNNYTSNMCFFKIVFEVVFSNAIV